MSLRGRVMLATACGLVLAGIVHIVTVLAIPQMADQAAFRLARSSRNLDHPMRVHTLTTAAGSTPAQGWLPVPDPAVAVGVCAYDLDDGPMRFASRVGSLTLSIAVHGRRGAFYAVTDQAAVRGSLDLVIMTRAQYDEALANDTEEASRDVRVVAPEREGFAVVRVIAALPSQRGMANDAVDAVSCSTDAPQDAPDAEAKPGG